MEEQGQGRDIHPIWSRVVKGTSLGLLSRGGIFRNCGFTAQAWRGLKSLVYTLPYCSNGEESLGPGPTSRPWQRQLGKAAMFLEKGLPSRRCSWTCHSRCSPSFPRKVLWFSQNGKLKTQDTVLPWAYGPFLKYKVHPHRVAFSSPLKGREGESALQRIPWEPRVQGAWW